jgi:chorismate mutase
VTQDSGEAEVSELRKAIAAIDTAMAESLERRLDLARTLSERKRKSRLALYAPAQEVTVQRRLRAAAGPGVPLESTDAIARELVSAGLRVQGALGVGYVGAGFGTAWVAARQAFGSAAGLRGVGSLQEALRLLEGRELDYAVAELCPPLLEAIAAGGLRICREVELLGTGRFAVVGEEIAQPCGEDTTLVRLLGWQGPTLEGPAPALPWTESWRLGSRDLVVELPGHPETGALSALEPFDGELFEGCEVLGAWAHFPGEPVKP